MATISQYFFLVYYSDPRRERVRIYIDGDSHYISMTHKDMINLIVTTAGYPIESAVRETLNSHGTFWLFDREASTIRQLHPSNSEDIINVQKEIQAGVASHQASQQEPTINPAERYAQGAPEIPAMNDLPTIFDNTRRKEKSRFGINIPLQK